MAANDTEALRALAGAWRNRAATLTPGSGARNAYRICADEMVAALAHAAPPEADRTAGEAVAWLLLRSDAEGDWQSVHSDHGACSPAEATVRAMAEMLGGRVVPLYARADLAPEAVEAAHSLIDAYRRAFNATGWKLWGPLDNEIARLESAIAAHPPAAAAPARRDEEPDCPHSAFDACDCYAPPPADDAGKEKANG